MEPVQRARELGTERRRVQSLAIDEDDAHQVR